MKTEDSRARKILEKLYPQASCSVTTLNRPVRAAVYLRQSTLERQNYESTEEQLEFIRHRLASGQIKSHIYPQGNILILEECIFPDRGKTGRVGREKYDAFKEGIRQKLFEVGLVFDLSRLTRELGSLLDAYDLAQSNNVEIISVSEMLSSHAEGAKNHFIFKGFANELQSEATSRNTRRGLELRALSGKSTGHLCFGFESIPENPERIRQPNEPANRLPIINKGRAAIVFRIFNLYDETSLGVDGVARLLNNEGIPAPKGGKWLGRTIWEILKQPKYIGVWIYGKTRIARDGTKDKIVEVPRPQSEWIVKEYEHLRIIPQPLWDRVQTKMKKIEEERRIARNKPESIWGKNRGQSNHLLTGAMVCGHCGANFITVSGKNGGYCGCFNAYRKGDCKNKQSVRTSWLESAIIGEMKNWLIEPQTLQFLTKEYNRRINEKISIIPEKIRGIEEELKRVEKEILNYVNFIREGCLSMPLKSVAEALGKAEGRQQVLKAQINNLKGQEPKGVFVTPAAIQSVLGNLDEILAMDVGRANHYLKALFPKPIKMTPKKQERQYQYVAEGEVNLTRLYRYCLPVNGVPTGI